METILKVNKLSKKIGKREILTDVSFEINKGEIVGFIGPNGAGKTTTIKCCCGLAQITSGEVLVEGFSIKKDFEKAIKLIGISANCNNFYSDLTAYENIKCLFPNKKFSKQQIDDTFEMVNLSLRKDSQVKTYSLGMKQRLSLALALINNPHLVLLDEPFNGVDPSGVADFRQMILEQSKTSGVAFLISSHNLGELAKVSTRNIFIDHGKIVKQEDECEAFNILRLKVDNTELLTKWLACNGFSFDECEDEVLIRTLDSQYNDIMYAITALKLKILQMSTESLLEKEYLEMLGESKID